MRNCDNCIYGSYGLDCNTGTETLYCGIYGYEWDVMPEDLCPEHQFIDGYGNENIASTSISLEQMIQLRDYLTHKIEYLQS